MTRRYLPSATNQNAIYDYGLPTRFADPGFVFQTPIVPRPIIPIEIETCLPERVEFDRNYTVRRTAEIAASASLAKGQADMMCTWLQNRNEWETEARIRTPVYRGRPLDILFGPKLDFEVETTFEINYKRR